jgi:sodium transport system permease protein
MMRAAWPVFVKELVDALRDRRTLAVVLLSSVAIGPLLLVVISTLVAKMEQRAEARVVVALGIEHAPTLRNFLERQNYTVREAPADHERALKEGRLEEPVLVVPPGFEDGLRSAEPPQLELLSSSGNQRAELGVRALQRLLQGFNQEQATLRLALRGVAPAALEAVQVQVRDLADRGGRAAQLTLMLPFFVVMAVLYGALNAALDTTAGERERGSLEPLLTNPTPRGALVLGKWGAVASVGMLIAVLSVASFLPGQWLLRSEALAALFQFGLREAAWFVALLLPLAGALAALLMAVAIRCKSFKEAQANSTLVVLGVTLLPLVNVLDPVGSAPWHLWVPALAQVTLMARVLRGEMPLPADLALTTAVAAAVTVLALLAVARTLRTAALK